jgi:hypothetical protein
MIPTALLFVVSWSAANQTTVVADVRLALGLQHKRCSDPVGNDDSKQRQSLIPTNDLRGPPT